MEATVGNVTCEGKHVTSRCLPDGVGLALARAHGGAFLLLFLLFWPLRTRKVRDKALVRCDAVNHRVAKVALAFAQTQYSESFEKGGGGGGRGRMLNVRGCSYCVCGMYAHFT